MSIALEPRPRLLARPSPRAAPVAPISTCPPGTSRSARSRSSSTPTTAWSRSAAGPAGRPPIWPCDARPAAIHLQAPGGVPLSGGSRRRHAAERYQQAVQQQRQELEAGYAHQGRWPAVDLSGLAVEVPPDRFFAPPMATLAAARASRQAVATCPGALTLMRFGSYCAG
jgi:hypothetical protein